MSQNNFKNKTKRKAKTMKKILMTALVVAGCVVETVAGKVSSFREESYNPSWAEREGLAFLRVVTTPLVYFTQAAQYLSETSEANGTVTPDDVFITTPVVASITGSIFACGEIVVGVGEMVTGQQLKSFAYPWEIKPNDPATVARIRERTAQERAAGMQGDERTNELVGELVSSAIDRKMQKHYNHRRK